LNILHIIIDQVGEWALEQCR